MQVLLYATALNEVVEEDGIEAKSDGEKIIKRMWNRTITGMSPQCLNKKLKCKYIMYIKSFLFYHFDT